MWFAVLFCMTIPIMEFASFIYNQTDSPIRELVRFIPMGYGVTIIYVYVLAVYCIYKQELSLLLKKQPNNIHRDTFQPVPSDIQEYDLKMYEVMVRLSTGKMPEDYWQNHRNVWEAFNAGREYERGYNAQ